MQYVDLDATSGGLTGIISPAAYLERLPALAGALPEGARAFALDADHYDFPGRRCVKDLVLDPARSGEPGGGGSGVVELRFRHNCRKHEEDLVIRYTGVAAFEVETPTGPDRAGLGTVILDEILPHPVGCTHEIAFRPGTLTVTCRDLTATWTEAECPDRP
ncbi:hypothetical protein [Kitasatospora sp. NBC_00458]|uniref:hypothetical protein n=1 Tax=Kitasatospora sp. NBC_00458 TaxID=2903568 RepID=UPI002E18D120